MCDLRGICILVRSQHGHQTKCTYVPSPRVPLAARAIQKSFYDDDCLTGADDVQTASALQQQLQELFTQGGFLLRKWSSSEPSILQCISPELREAQEIHPISNENGYTRMLGLEWNVTTDQFQLTVSGLPSVENLTKRILVSDMAKVFDVLGWFAPAIVAMKILLQKVWELGVDWDDAVPKTIQDAWAQWRSELLILSTRPITSRRELQLFQDNSMDTVMRHLRMLGQIVWSYWAGWPGIHGGSYLKTYVGNHVSLIMDQILPDRWSHVISSENPADCSSCGLLPSELLDHKLWWKGPTWLSLSPPHWPKQPNISVELPPEEERDPRDLSGQHHCTAWPTHCTLFNILTSPTCHCLDSMFCEQLSTIKRSEAAATSTNTPRLTVAELVADKKHVFCFLNIVAFPLKIALLKSGENLPRGSDLLSLHPFVDTDGMVHVEGRQHNSQLTYSRMHPIILHGNQSLARLIICSEHLCLLHALEPHSCHRP